jgi:hypothetical protein
LFKDRGLDAGSMKTKAGRIFSACAEIRHALDRPQVNDRFDRGAAWSYSLAGFSAGLSIDANI